jgi:hypothetical protein
MSSMLANQTPQPDCPGQGAWMGVISEVLSKGQACITSCGSQQSHPCIGNAHIVSRNVVLNITASPCLTCIALRL